MTHDSFLSQTVELPSDHWFHTAPGWNSRDGWRLMAETNEPLHFFQGAATTRFGQAIPCDANGRLVSWNAAYFVAGYGTLVLRTGNTATWPGPYFADPETGKFVVNYGQGVEAVRAAPPA